MIIVIEGSDLVGKSTVVNVAEQAFDSVIGIHSGKIPENVRSNCFGKILSFNDEMMYRIFQEVTKKTPMNFVIDRYMVSELVYSKLTKRIPAETLEDIKNKDLHIIILTVKEDILTKRYENRGDKRFKLNEIINLNNLFFNFYKENKSNLKNIYHFQNNNKQDLKKIIEFIRCLLIDKRV